MPFESVKPILLVRMLIGASSYYCAVAADYTFKLQNTRDLPKEGVISIQMPYNWTKHVFRFGSRISSLYGEFTTEKLIYNALFITEPNYMTLVKIQIFFEWPAGQQLIIKFDNLLNPKTPFTTGNFRVYTEYDSKILDQSRPEPSELENYLNKNENPPDLALDPKYVALGIEY